jgi:hypothetical protein
MKFRIVAQYGLFYIQKFIDFDWEFITENISTGDGDGSYCKYKVVFQTEQLAEEYLKKIIDRKKEELEESTLRVVKEFEF